MQPRDDGRVNFRRHQRETEVLSMRRFLQRLEEDEPAFAVAARAAGERRRERQIERGDLPPLPGAATLHRDLIRLQQVVGRRVLAVLVLDALEDRELGPWTHVHFELRDAVDDVVVDALGVASVALAARLPAALQDVARIVGKRCELR